MDFEAKDGWGSEGNRGMAFLEGVCDRRRDE